MHHKPELLLLTYIVSILVYELSQIAHVFWVEKRTAVLPAAILHFLYKEME